MCTIESGAANNNTNRSQSQYSNPLFNMALREEMDQSTFQTNAFWSTTGPMQIYL
jgi:hypothetical protein